MADTLDQYVWIVVDEEAKSSKPDGTRDGGLIPNPYEQPKAVEPALRRGIPIKAEKLQQGMTEFLQVMGRVLGTAQQHAGELAGMELEEIELSVEVNSEGQLSLWGTGGKVGGKGAMTLKFKKAGPK